MRISKLVAALVAIAAPVAAFAATVSVTVSNFAFTPANVTIAPGDTVQWNFTSTHTSTSDAAIGLEVWDSGVLSSGSFSHTFTNAGSFPYHCNLHPSMTGVVNVAAAATTLTSINPTSGTAAGGTNVTLTGTNFTGPCTLDFGGVAGTAVAVVNSTTMTATTPAHAAGTVNVTVSCASGSATLTNGFTFSAPAAAVPALSTPLLALLLIALASTAVWTLRD